MTPESLQRIILEHCHDKPGAGHITAHTFSDFPRCHIASVMFTRHCQFQLINQSSLLMRRLDWLLYSINTGVITLFDLSNQLNSYLLRNVVRTTGDPN